MSEQPNTPEQRKRVARYEGARNTRALWVGAVVLLIIAVGVFVQNRRQRRDQSAQQLAVSRASAYPAGQLQQQKMEIQVTPLPAAPPENTAGPRGGTRAQQARRDALSAALEPYRNGDYLSAMPALQQLTQQSPDYGEAALYLGVSQVMTWQNVQAAQTLAKAAAELDGQRRQAAEWYRAIALLRTGDDAAQQAFSALCGEGGEPYGQPSCEVSQQLATRAAQTSYSVPR